MLVTKIVSTGVTAFGKTCRHEIRLGPAPFATAVRM